MTERTAEQDAANRAVPFTIAVPQPVLDDLRARLHATRWPDELPDVGWDQGTSLGYLQSLVSTWAEGFDWRTVEARLNRLHQFRTELGGLGVHFVHERGQGPAPFPLILTHGWPSTFTEYVDLIPLLTNPGAYGGDPSDAFDVVAPSLPGYGFSDRPEVQGMVNATVAVLWCELMRGLGYSRFGAHGSDIGAGITTRLGRHYPNRVAGIHLAAVGFTPPPQPWTDAETAYWADVAAYEAEEGAYSDLQATKPQTLGYGLTDSPAGLAAWIVEKFRSWSDCRGEVETRFTREQILTNLTIYWVTQSATSSTRLYWDYRHHGSALAAGDLIETPAGFAIFANEFRSPGRPPRELAERYYTVQRWTEMPRGGHFPALEEPELLAEDIRAFFRPLRTAEQ